MNVVDTDAARRPPAAGSLALGLALQLPAGKGYAQRGVAGGVFARGSRRSRRFAHCGSEGVELSRRDATSETQRNAVQRALQAGRRSVSDRSPSATPQRARQHGGRVGAREVQGPPYRGTPIIALRPPAALRHYFHTF